MSPNPNTAPDELVWPPPEEDLDSIEVLELPWPEPAPTPPPAPPPATPPVAAPAAASAEAAPAATPAAVPAEVAPGAAPSAPPHPVQDVIEVVELDAIAGTESYVLDIRSASGADGEPRHAPRDDVDDSGGGLQWPPSEADLDAVEVLDLTPPGTALVAPDVGGQPATEADPPALGQCAAGTPPALDQATEGPREASVPAGPSMGPRLGSLLLEPATADETPRPFRRIALGLGLVAAVAGGAWAGMTWMRQPQRQFVAAAPDRAASPVAPGAAGAPAAAPEAPAVEGDSAATASLLGDARAALEAGDRMTGLDLLSAYRQQGGRDPAAAALADQVLTGVRAELDRARRDAATRLGATAANDLAETSRREAAARQAWQEGQYGRALRELADARRAVARLQPPAASALPQGTSASPVADGSSAGVAVRPTQPAAAPPPPQTSAPASPARAAADVVSPAGAGPDAPPATAAVAAPPPAATGASTAAAPTGSVDAGVRRALRAYQSAYETLDARAAAAVYPAVDERALARAFAGLNSQKLEFERCEVTAQADGRARASCTGRAAYVPRVGNQTPRVEQRRWNFVLEANGDAWRIAQAQVSAR